MVLAILLGVYVKIFTDDNVMILDISLKDWHGVEGKKWDVTEQILILNWQVLDDHGWPWWLWVIVGDVPSHSLYSSLSVVYVWNFHGKRGLKHCEKSS